MSEYQKAYRAAHLSKFRVKIKSLAEEARIIKTETRRLCKRHPEVQYILEWHRRDVVRPESRATLLAYAFIRGVPYAKVENPAEDNPPPLDRAAAIIKSLTRRDIPYSDLAEWSKLSKAEVA